MSRSALSVFISYAREDNEHSAWVRRLANALEAMPDLHVIFDQYDVHGGKDLTHFMEIGVSADRIVAVVTPEYVMKANARRGGVGYESSVISAQLFDGELADRCIPVLRRGDDRPNFLKSKVYVDFRDDRAFESCVNELARSLRSLAPAERPRKSSGTETVTGAADGETLPAKRTFLDANRPVVIVNFDVDGRQNSAALPSVENVGLRPAANVTIEDIRVAGNRGRGHFGEIGLLRPGETREVTFRADGEGPFWQSNLIAYLESDLENRPRIDWSNAAEGDMLLR